MEDPKKQIVDSLQKANNVLVTVRSNPTVDQLAAAIGFTLLLNKLGKHATAVYSGATPSTIEFLQPDKTLEKNTDSLRDFIIALDKSKADKLRYKVEDQMVKIFITPYRTSIGEDDLEFSQGDFNVDVVVALGVNEQTELDQAITGHGRILHDATVVSVSTQPGASLGSVNWIDAGASSLSEMMLDAGLALKADVLDGQMATAFLTGIVSETDRFSNEKTSSTTMQLSAKLMAAGANQQLVATQLQSPERDNGVLPAPVEADQPEDNDAPAASPDGSLQIDHAAATQNDEPAPQVEKNETPSADTSVEAGSAVEEPAHPAEPEEPPVPQVHIDENGDFNPDTPNPDSEPAGPTVSGGPHIILDPPTTGGTLTASGTVAPEDNATDVLGIPSSEPTMPLLSHDRPEPPKEPAPIEDPEDGTLAEIEKLVNSPHITQEPTAEADQADTSSVDAARDAVSEVVTGVTPQILEPVKSLNAQPMDLNLGDTPAVSIAPASEYEHMAPPAPVPADQLNPQQPTDSDTLPPPPPVPPPMMPPTDPAQSAL